jgi:hypothetical protein
MCFVLQEFLVLLNDFGSCHLMEVSGSESSPVEFAGCMQHASDLILRSLQQKKPYLPSFKDDLLMFVRMVFLCLRPVRLSPDPASLIQFWHDVGQSHSFYRRGMEIADLGDYTSLKEWVRQLSLPDRFCFPVHEKFPSVVQPDFVSPSPSLSANDEQHDEKVVDPSEAVAMESDPDILTVYRSGSGKRHLRSQCSGRHFDKTARERIQRSDFDNLPAKTKCQVCTRTD